MLKSNNKKKVKSKQKSKVVKKVVTRIPRNWLVGGTFLLKTSMKSVQAGIYGWEKNNDTLYSPMYLDNVKDRMRFFIKGLSVAKLQKNLPITMYDINSKRIGTIQRIKSGF